MNAAAPSIVNKIRKLSRRSLPVRTSELAYYLIGKTLIHNVPGGRMSGRIVETEAYPPGDTSGHAYRGRTARNESLFLGRGFAYVYFAYGCWYMMNVTSERAGVGAGVLLRALEPLEGIELMQRLRGVKDSNKLARGPGLLAEAIGIDNHLDGVDLCSDSPLWLGTAVRKTQEIATSSRIGISKETKRLLRFFEYGNPCVSGPKTIRK